MIFAVFIFLTIIQSLAIRSGMLKFEHKYKRESPDITLSRLRRIIGYDASKRDIRMMKGTLDGELLKLEKHAQIKSAISMLFSSGLFVMFAAFSADSFLSFIELPHQFIWIQNNMTTFTLLCLFLSIMCLRKTVHYSQDEFSFRKSKSFLNDI